MGNAKTREEGAGEAGKKKKTKFYRVRNDPGEGRR
jgi:hypothetical protein